MWWTLTLLLHLRTSTTLHVWTTTNVPCHQFMSWSHYEPAKHLVTRVIRGLIVNCGYRYVWDTPTVEEQREPGNTYIHSFRLINLHTWQHVWLYHWTPIGPYGRQCQGPLLHVLPISIPEWPEELYVATKLKGVYHTNTMSGPTGPQPTWSRVNGGLHSLSVRQLICDPIDPDRTQYALVGPAGSRKIYKRDPYDGPDWYPILTNAEALTLTGSVSGELTWIASTPHHPNMIYALFTSGLVANGIWCLRTGNRGYSWAAFQITASILSYRAGNLCPAILQGTSPYDPANVLYAALNVGLGGGFSLYRSLDNGTTWARADTIGGSVATPACYPDPVDASRVYMTAHLNIPNPWELCRSTQHGDNLVEVDGALHLGHFLDTLPGNLWLHNSDNSTARLTAGYSVYKTVDGATTWATPGPCPYPVRRLHVLSPRPNNLYLGRTSTALGPPFPTGPHTLWVSTDEGATAYGKSGLHPEQPDGGGDSIPYDAGGISLSGIMHTVIT